MNVARLDTVFDRRPRTFPLQTIALEMRKGHSTLANLRADAPARTLAETTDYARETLEARGADAYNIIKETMPQFMPAVTTASRSVDDLIAFSELVCVEWDTPEMDTDSAMALLCQNPYVVLAWRSLGRKPKVLCRIAPESIDSEALSFETFPHAWVTAAALFEELGDADPAAARPFQLQNICHDPDLYLNLTANKLQWSVDHQALQEMMPDGFETSTFALLSELGQEYIDAIERMEFNEKGIGSERVPCPFETHQNDGWGLRSNATRIIRHDENDHSLECFKCSTRRRYNKTGQATTRYTIDRDHQHETSDIDTERAENKNVVVTWLSCTEKKKGKHLLILGSAAGSAKTTITTTQAETLLYIAKTTEEADKVFEELYKNGEDVVRHRPRMFNRGHKDFDNRPDWETLPLGLGSNERPCLHPQECNRLAENGQAPTDFCVPFCAAYLDCKEKAYLSQADRERQASKVVYALNEVVACDETKKQLVARICAADEILIVDEVNPLAVSQARCLDRETVYDLTERFRQPHEETAPLFEKLKTLLDLTGTAETPETFIRELQGLIDSIDDVKAFDAKIEKYPVGVTFRNTKETATHEQPFEASITYQSEEVTVPVVDFDTAPDTAAFFVDPETPIETGRYQIRFVSFRFLLKVGLACFEAPPRKHRKLLADVKTFFAENTNIAEAPFIFDPKKQSFEFYLKPTLNHRRTIFNTASDPDNLIGEAYRETDVQITRHTGTPPPWKTDLVFQLSTGNYLPRQSLVKSGADKTLHLKSRAQELVDAFILPSIAAGQKTLVVAPKAFQDIESVVGDDRFGGGWAVIDRDDFDFGHKNKALLINHHHAEGRNDFQDFDIVFVFHYEPNHNELPIAAKRIYRNPETPLDFTREKRTVTVGGVSFEKMVYIDDRVQAVYNRECRARIMQSDMRLRPNIHPDKIIVHLTAEPIDIPVTPVPFSLKDAERFDGDWAVFKEKLQAAEKAIADGDATAYAEATGDSERTAQRRVKDVSDQQIAERDAEIIRRADAGDTQQKIADALDIRLATVNEILSEWKATRDAQRNAEIFRRYDAGETQEAIAAALGIKSKSTVSRVLKKRNF